MSEEKEKEMMEETAAENTEMPVSEPESEGKS